MPNGTESGKEILRRVLNTSTISICQETQRLAEALSEEGHSLVKAGHIELLESQSTGSQFIRSEDTFRYPRADRGYPVYPVQMGRSRGAI